MMPKTLQNNIKLLQKKICNKYPICKRVEDKEFKVFLRRNAKRNEDGWRVSSYKCYVPSEGKIYTINEEEYYALKSLKKIKLIIKHLEELESLMSKAGFSEENVESKIKKRLRGR